MYLDLSQRYIGLKIQDINQFTPTDCFNSNQNNEGKSPLYICSYSMLKEFTYSLGNGMGCRRLPSTNRQSSYMDLKTEIQIGLVHYC